MARTERVRVRCYRQRGFPSEIAHFFFMGLSSQLSGDLLEDGASDEEDRQEQRWAEDEPTGRAKYHLNHVASPAHELGRRGEDGEDAKITRIRRRRVERAAACDAADATRRCATGFAMCAPTRTRVWTMDAA